MADLNPEAADGATPIGAAAHPRSSGDGVPEYADLVESRLRTAHAAIREVIGTLRLTGLPERQTDGQGYQDLRRSAAALIIETEQSMTRLGLLDRVAAERLAALEWRALQAEVGLGRVRGRRWFRLANLVVGWLRRPWRVGWLVRGLRAALTRMELPVLPARPPAPATYLSGLVRPPAAPRRRPFHYPHLRVAHAGRLAMFEAVAPHYRVGEIDLEKEMATGFDMLLVEPGVDDRLEDLPAETLTRFADAGIPIVMVARTSDHLALEAASQAGLMVVEDPGLAQTTTSPTLVIHPSVDDRVHNPIGWQRQPANQLLVITDHGHAGPDQDLLAPLADRVTLYGANLAGITGKRPRPVGSDQAATAREHLAAYISPHLTATPTSAIQLALELTATGTPVIAPPDPTLDALLPGHYLPADDTTRLAAHLDTLEHPATRERHSVPARRHVLTHHTRRHRFEQLLTHLDIPTRPTPKISILLATNRPNQIEHALDSVTAQDWPDKELLLILHDPNQFDTTHIHQTTSQLPYPATIIPAPAHWTLGDCLNAGLDQATGDYITKMDDDDHYGPNHLTDLHTAHTYSHAQITGKCANIVYLARPDISLDWLLEREERFGTHIPGATMLTERAFLQHYRFARLNQGEESYLYRLAMAHGYRLYSTHRFNFVRVRHGHHAFQRGDEQFIADSSGEFRSGLDLSLAML